MNKGTSILLLVVASIVLVSQSCRLLGFYDRSTAMANNTTESEIQELARFAVREHNHNQNAALELVRVAKAEEQVVAGTLHHLTLEAAGGGKKMMYEAKVWVKPWMDFKQLQEFKYVGDAAAFTPSDLGARTDGYGFGWKAVPVDDPSVGDAADRAVNAIQQRSNSLIPYQLHQILEARAEVSDECAKFDMVVKLKRGEREEKMRVEVHKNTEGGLHLHKMEPLHPHSSASQMQCSST